MRVRYLSVNGLRRIGRLYKVGQTSAGDPDGVARSVSEAWVIARSIRDAFVRARAGHDNAEAQTNSGDIQGALTRVRRIEDATDCAWTLSGIAQALLDAADRP